MLYAKVSAREKLARFTMIYHSTVSGNLPTGIFLHFALSNYNNDVYYPHQLGFVEFESVGALLLRTC